MGRACPDDLAEVLHRLHVDLSFEVRTLIDLRRQMVRPQDEPAAAVTDATVALLQDLDRHLLPLLAVSDRFGFCCLLEWHWHLEWPRLDDALAGGRVACAALGTEDYRAHRHRLAPLAERELARYADAVRGRAG